MGQWGKERTFVEGEVSVRVLPHVSTVAFDPIVSTSVIDMLFLIDAEGETDATEKLFAELCKQHCHKPYVAW